MKKLIIASMLLSTLSFANNRSPAAAAPNTTAMPAKGGSWMMDDRTRGLTVTAPATGLAETTVGFAQFRSETESFRWDLGLAINKTDGEDARTGFSLGFGYRIYQFVSSSLKGFTQPGVLFGKANNGGGFEHDVFLGAYYRFGAEYFFSPNLAIGAMAGLALNFTNGFDVITFETDTTAVFLTWYW